MKRRFFLVTVIILFAAHFSWPAIAGQDMQPGEVEVIPPETKKEEVADGIDRDIKLSDEELQREQKEYQDDQFNPKEAEKYELSHDLKQQKQTIKDSTKELKRQKQDYKQEQDLYKQEMQEYKRQMQEHGSQMQEGRTEMTGHGAGKKHKNR